MSVLKAALSGLVLLLAGAVGLVGFENLAHWGWEAVQRPGNWAPAFYDSSFNACMFQLASASENFDAARLEKGCRCYVNWMQDHYSMEEFHRNSFESIVSGNLQEGGDEAAEACQRVWAEERAADTP